MSYTTLGNHCCQPTLHRQSLILTHNTGIAAQFNQIVNFMTNLKTI